MVPEYRFILRFGDPEQTHEIRPVWKDDLAIVWALESGQWFHRSSLSGQLVLQREDYALVMAQAFATKYYLDIYQKNGTQWGILWQGTFSLTDCTVNMDDERLTVKPQVIDEYTDILEGWEKEYDLIKLLPEVQKIKVTKRPMIQIYSEGASYINCFIGTVYFEQDVNTPAVDDMQGYMTEGCHFALISSYAEINFENPQAGFGAPFKGNLINGSYLTNTIGTYRLKYYEETYAVQQTTVYENGLQVVPSNSDTVLWEFKQQNAGALAGYKPLPVSMEFNPVGSSTGKLKANRASRFIYGRFITNADTFDGNATFEIKSNDLVPYNRNYRYCYPYTGTMTGVISDMFSFGYNGRYSQVPTQWGMNDLGQYFLPPGDSGWYPIGRTNWVNTSDWYYPSDAASFVDSHASYTYTLNDAYPIWSCIKKLLNEIAPDIHFDATTAYSTFMFRQVEVEDVMRYRDPIAGRNSRLYITPKSNITAGEYQTPAQTAPVTLKTLLDMMAKTYQLYWSIESVNVGGTIEKRLRIEHVAWYKNGGAYPTNPPTPPQIGFDLTAIKNVRNGKAWSFGTNEYSFEKADMPERYEFGWMDEVTEPFKGSPINILSPYVDKGKIENIDVAQFTSDVDMMLLNPSAFSPDGFVVMTMDDDGKLPMVQYNVSLMPNYLQNGLLSFWKLHDPYWLYDLPAKTVEVNGSTATARGVSRRKVQTVNLPYGMTAPDMRKLVKTGLGNGQIRQMSIKMTSRMAKTQLRYDTEE